MNYTELLNPQNSALILIDFQPQMVVGGHAGAGEDS